MQKTKISLIEQNQLSDVRPSGIIQNLEIFNCKIQSDFVDLKEWISQSKIPYLFQISHIKLTTLLEVTSITPYEIWYFDQDQLFTGKAFSLHQGLGNFRIQTQAKWILIFSMNDSIFQNFKNLNCIDLKLEV